MGPVFTLLQIALGVGIWQSAFGKRSIRIAGALVGSSCLWHPPSPGLVTKCGSGPRFMVPIPRDCQVERPEVA